MTKTEIIRIEKYMRRLFGNNTITIESRPRQTDSVEVSIDGEFIGVVYKNVEEGETSYDFNMAILEMDLPQIPVR